jgi:replication factor A1
MFKIPLNELKEKVRQGAHLTEEEMDLKIKKKINDLSGLISEEGAAHIIANELGVKIVEEGRRLKIKSIYAGMKGVEVLGKVMSKTEIRVFEKENRKGKVGNIVIGDDTGTMRVVCWNEQAEVLDKIKENDVVLFKSGYVKENNFNQKELHLNDRSKVLINPEGESVGEVRQGFSYERKKVGELKEGMNGVELLGTVVQVFEPRFFNVCPECAKKVVEKEDGFECGEHGKVEAVQSYVMNLILDDGTGAVRSVFWKNQTNNLLGKNEEDLLKFKSNPGSFEEVKTELLGEQFRLVGRVNHNDMFERLEFSVQMVFKADAVEEIRKLEGE